VDAERFASSIEYELNRGSFFDPKLGQVKFKDLAEKWFKTRTANPSTIKQNDIHLRHHILPYWGEKPIGAIKNSDIQTWIAQLNDAGLSARYVRLVFANFRLVLEVAVRDELLSKNPAVARNFSFPPVSNQRVEVWTPDQFKAILEALPPEAKLMTLLGGTCGLRQGEIFGVRVQDLDLERGVITVRQQITALDYKPTPALTKNRRTRSVPHPS
jgi:integrase